MVQVPGGRVTESPQSRKTTGGADLPNTKQPAQSAAYDNTVAPFNHDGNDVSGYIGVSSEYRTYSDVRNKPLGTTAERPVFLSDQPETESVRSPEAVADEVPSEDGDGKPKRSARKRAAAKAPEAPHLDNPGEGNKGNE